MAKRKDSRFDDLEPQKSSAAQFLTYIAANGVTNEKFEIRYEGETIWMSQKMLAAVYGVDLRTVGYHITKIFKDAELDKKTCIQKYWIHLELFMSDYDRYLLALEEEAKRTKGETGKEKS